MNVLEYLSKLKHSHRLEFIRKYTNLLYYDPRTVPIELATLDYVVVDKLYKFYATEQINSLQRVVDNPWFEGVRADDVVVDIGACIGAITIPMAYKAKVVYAVEPLYDRELQRNTQLNALENVFILKYAVGPEHTTVLPVSFDRRKESVEVITFEDLKKRVGEQIDFLKMDGEGCEWHIRPEELSGIRELRIEFHIRRGRVRECKQKYREYITWLQRNRYKLHIEHPRYGPDPYDKEDYMVRATLEVI